MEQKKMRSLNSELNDLIYLKKLPDRENIVLLLVSSQNVI